MSRLFRVEFTAGLVLCAVVSMVGAQTTLSTGGADSWNTGTWSAGVPAGAVDAVIASGIQAEVNNAATPVYTGSLTLNSASKLWIRSGDASTNALGGGPITLDGATLDINDGGSIMIPAINVTGDSILDIYRYPEFTGTISGTGELQVIGINNTYYDFNTANTFSGGLVLDSTADRCAAFFKASGSGGAGDITVIPRADGRYFWIILQASDVFADTATMTLDGKVGQNGGMNSTANREFLVMGNNTDTIDKLFVKGFPYPAGTYGAIDTSATVDHKVRWLDGNGVLTTLSDAATDAIAPSLTNISDNAGGGPIIPSNTVIYTVRFDEPIFSSTLTVDDFENGGSAAVTIDSVSVNEDELAYSVAVTVSDAGTLLLQVKAGAAVTDLFGNPLDTASAIADDDTIEVSRLPELWGQLGILDTATFEQNFGKNPATGEIWKRGDTYRLAFVTIATTNTVSANVADYDAFVQSVAAGSSTFSNLNEVSWKWIASTATVDARDNTATAPGDTFDGPIYRLDSTKVADNYADLWDGQPGATIDRTEENTVRANDTPVWTAWCAVWTGSGSSGTASSPLGGASVGHGLLHDKLNMWMSRSTAANTTLLPMYAMSEPLEVQGFMGGTVLIIK